MKEADPEFYRDASSLQYGKVSISTDLPANNSALMVHYIRSCLWDLELYPLHFLTWQAPKIAEEKIDKMGIF